VWVCLLGMSHRYVWVCLLGMSHRYVWVCLLGMSHRYVWVCLTGMSHRYVWVCLLGLSHRYVWVCLLGMSHRYVWVCLLGMSRESTPSLQPISTSAIQYWSNQTAHPAGISYLMVSRCRVWRKRAPPSKQIHFFQKNGVVLNGGSSSPRLLIWKAPKKEFPPGGWGVSYEQYGSWDR